MLKKLLFVYVFLFAYSGAIIHSIVPHHHHDSHEEATKTHHHGDQSSHSHHDKAKDSKHEQTDSLYFLTHTINADIVVNHSSSFTESAKGKATQETITAYFELPQFDFAFSFQVFHPPSGDFITENPLYLCRALRAPPSLIA